MSDDLANTDLVVRLREAARNVEGRLLSSELALGQAAGRIEALQAENARLREALIRINMRLSPAPDRTFDGLIYDAGVSCDYARAALEGGDE